MARILLLDGHSSAALAFTRSAGRAGHFVAVGANRGLFASAKLSRYCDLAFDYPSCVENSQIFLDAIVDFARVQSIDLIIPITDWTIQPVSEQRKRFEGICRVVLPPHEAVLSAADKHRTVELAKRQGIPVPRTWLVNNAGDLDGLKGLSFPVVVKDRFSMRWQEGRGTPGSVAYAFSEAELRNIAECRLRAAPDVLVQEFVPGTGVGISLFIMPDEMFVPFQWQRIREVDPRGSASSARKSVPLDRSLLTRSYRLVQSMGFLGIAMVEYKLSSTGAVLMEVNGRPWGSIGLAIESGIDYPRYLVDWYLQGNYPPSSIAYKDVTCRRLVAELTHLSNVRRGKPENWPEEYPGFWSTAAKIAIPWYPGMHYDDLWVSDPRPGLAQLWNWFHVRKKR